MWRMRRLVGMAHARGPGPLLVVAEAEARLHLAAQAAQGGGRDDALRGPADAHDGVHAGARDGARDGRREVAVGDELDARAGAPDLLDEVGVPRPIQDDDRDVVGPAAQRRGDPLDVLGRADGQIHVAGHDGSDAELLEVRVGRVQQAPALGRGQDGDGVGLTARDQVGALQRVDRDVDLRLVRQALADLLADEEHGRLVPLALPDDDRALHLELVHRPPHRLGRRRGPRRRCRPGPCSAQSRWRPTR